MTNSIQSIALDKLVAHPDNPNRMSKVNFGKLVRNIERSGRYEPLTVRPCPPPLCFAKRSRGGCFQIINGYHRCQALAKLGYKTADCVVWDIDDEETDILLATLNRLGGSDELAKKLKLLKRLSKRTEANILARILPQTRSQIERLTNLRMPSAPAKINAKCFANPLVFFVNDSQQERIEKALLLVEEVSVSPLVPGGTPLGGDALRRSPKDKAEVTRAAKRAAALTHIAGYFLRRTPNGVNHSKINSRT